MHENLDWGLINIFGHSRSGLGCEYSDKKELVKNGEVAIGLVLCTVMTG